MAEFVFANSKGDVPKEQPHRVEERLRAGPRAPPRSLTRLRLIGEIDPGADSLRFYFMGSNWKGNVEHIGACPSLDLEDPLLV